MIGPGMTKHRLLYEWHERKVTRTVGKTTRALTNHSARNAGDNCERWRILGHNRPSSYDGAFADRHTRQYLDAGRDPYVVLEDYWAALHTKCRVHRVMLERPQPNACREIHMPADGQPSAAIQDSPVANDRSFADADAFRFAKFGASIDDDPRTKLDAGGTVRCKTKSLRWNVADKTEKEELQAVAVPAILAFGLFEPGYDRQYELLPSPSHGPSPRHCSLPASRRSAINFG